MNFETKVITDENDSIITLIIGFAATQNIKDIMTDMHVGSLFHYGIFINALYFLFGNNMELYYNINNIITNKSYT